MIERILRRDNENGGQEFIVFDQYGDEHAFGQFADAYNAFATGKYFVKIPKNPKVRPLPPVIVEEVKDEIGELLEQLAEIESRIKALTNDLKPTVPVRTGIWNRIKNFFR